MPNKFALYVDAGYLLEASATRLGTSYRKSIKADWAKLVGLLQEQASALAGIPLLRVHWYDAAPDALPRDEHAEIGALPQVKVRLGRIDLLSGTQKGVDLRIGLDMVTQARNGAVEAIVLVSGDDDLTEAVEEAQVHGVEVVVLAVPDKDGQPHGVARNLRLAADRLELVHDTTLDQTITLTNPMLPGKAVSPAIMAKDRPGQPAGRKPQPVMTSQTGRPTQVPSRYKWSDDDMDFEIPGVAKRVLEGVKADPEALHALGASRPQIPAEIDRALLVDLAHRFDDYNLPDSVRKRLREMFWRTFDEITP